MTRRCSARTGSGKRCRAYAMKGDTRCIFHSINEVKYKTMRDAIFRAGRKRRY